MGNQAGLPSSKRPRVFCASESLCASLRHSQHYALNETHMVIFSASLWEMVTALVPNQPVLPNQQKALKLRAFCDL